MITKKTFALFFLLSGMCLICSGQNWLSLVPETSRNEPKFRDFSEAFYTYWSMHEHENGQAYKHFKRMEWRLEPRLDETGEVPSGVYYDEIERITRQRKEKDNAWGDWTNLGPAFTPNWMNQTRLSGSGRLDWVEFHPLDTNTIWVGAHSGGFWKTTDGGVSWYTTTDHLPSIGVSTIVVHPFNPDILYIGTGDRDSFVAFGVGVLKSFDGGETWEQTGLIHQLPENKIINKLLIHPITPEILYATTSHGIFKTTDDGVNWTLIQGGHFKDIVFKPDNPETLFATSFNYYGNARIYKTTDSGNTWQDISSPAITPSTVCRISLGVTPANPDLVYAICARPYPNAYLLGLFKSNDAGQTWQQTISGDVLNLLGRSAAGNDTEGYGWYTLTVAVSPTDEDLVFTGGVNLWKSTTGGYDWQLLTHENPYTPNVYNTWVDYHDMRFRPGTEQLFCCHDGGIIKTYDYGSSFSNITDGLEILQIYKIGLSATNEEKALCGDQDQFTMYKNGDEWHCMPFGESGENFFDYTNPLTFYMSGYGGGLRRTVNGGTSASNITPPGQSLYLWLAPFIIHPTDPNTIFVGFNDVFMSVNKGTQWSKISESLSNTQLRILEIAPSEPQVMVAGLSTALWKTADGGQNWENILPGLPPQRITDVCISSSDPNHFYATIGGFTNGSKVYESINGGLNWQNISLNLPNVPATCIAYQNGTNDAVYVGTDLGVFYKNNDLDEWIDFSSGLPNVVLGEIEIHYGSSKLRAGTYGRGLWETPLMDPTILSINTEAKSKWLMFPNPADDKVNVHFETNDDEPIRLCIRNIVGIAEKKLVLHPTQNRLELAIPVEDLLPGIYFFTFESKNHRVTHRVVIK